MGSERRTLADAPVGTVSVRGAARFQKQRNGEWLRIGPARAWEIKPKKSGEGLAASLPASRKSSPAVPSIVIPIGHKWKDASPDLPESTFDEFFKDEEPKPQRKALHERILRVFGDSVEPAASDRKPVAVLVIGGPISGRSSVLKALTNDSLFALVDPGTIAVLIPEYQDAIKKFARNAPSIVQAEASFVAVQLLQDLTEDRKNIAVGAVGAEADMCVELLESLQDRGYHTVLIYTDLDRADMIRRNIVRGLRTGVWVPHDAFVLGKVVEHTFKEISESADDVLRIDTRKAPKHVNEALFDALALIEDDDDDEDSEEGPEIEEPEVPSVKLSEIKRRAIEGIRKERNRIDTLPEKYERNEGIVLAHYDDAHVQEIPDPEEEDLDSGEEEPNGGEEPEEGVRVL